MTRLDYACFLTTSIDPLSQPPFGSSSPTLTMAPSVDYSAILKTFVKAFPAGDKASLASLTAKEVTANGGTVSRDAFVDFLMSAFAVASPHKMTIDLTTFDTVKRALAVRLLHEGVLVEPYLGVEVTGEEVEWPEHLVLTFNDEDKINGCHGAFGFGGPTKISAKDVKVQPTQSRPTIPPPADFNIIKAYNGYITANNTHTIRTYFPTFIHSSILNNGTPNTLEEFTAMIESNWEALQGVQLHVKNLLVDEEQQHVCADLELTATPVKEFHGVPPNGKPVKFGEIAFYKFNGGRVELVWVVLDLRKLGK